MVSEKKTAKNKGFRRFFKVLGPGLITGASDDDPSGIATYAQTGAVFGYRNLWLTLFSLPFMTAVQQMCGKIGIVTGKGLAGTIRARYGKPILFGVVFLLFLANTVNIGADLGAMAASAKLLLPGHFIFWLVFFTLLVVTLQVLVPYRRYAKILKYLAFSLFAYVFAAFFVHVDWGEVLKGTFLPSFSLSPGFLMNVVAFMGTTISPYLFFWQTSEEVEEEVVKGEIREMGKGIPKFSRRDIRDMKTDTVVGMFFSNLVSFFIILVSAAALHQNGLADIATADQAAAALLPFAGQYAFLLFAAGIVGTGLLSVPVLAGSASYAVSESLGWREGLGKRFRKARAFYGVIILATLLGLVVNLLPIPPFRMLYYAAVLNGIVAPPLLFFILRIANDRKIMSGYVNSRSLNVLGYTVAFLMSFSVLLLFFFLFRS